MKDAPLGAIVGPAALVLWSLASLGGSWSESLGNVFRGREAGGPGADFAGLVDGSPNGRLPLWRLRLR